MATTTAANDPVELTQDQATRVVAGIMESAGPGGVREDEIERKFNIVAAKLRKLRVGAALWELFKDGRIDVRLSDDETDLDFIPVEHGSTDLE